MESFTTTVAGHRRRLPNKLAAVTIDISEGTEPAYTKAALAKRILGVEKQMEDIRHALTAIQADLSRLLDTESST
jgi:hypothetical protein